MISSTVRARAKVAAEADDLTKRLEKLQRELKAEQQVGRGLGANIGPVCAVLMTAMHVQTDVTETLRDGSSCCLRSRAANPCDMID